MHVKSKFKQRYEKKQELCLFLEREKAKNFVSYEIEVVRFIVLCSNRERDSFFSRAKVGHFV